LKTILDETIVLLNGITTCVEEEEVFYISVFADDIHETHSRIQLQSIGVKMEAARS
jgi:hypothetical protein